MTGMSRMRTTMTRTSFGAPEGTPHASMSASIGVMVYTRIAMIMTVMRNAVPQRTCRRGKLRAFSGVSGNPCSKQWMVLCSAPW